MHLYLIETRSAQIPLGLFKPNGLHVKKLFDPLMCQSGNEQLSPGSQPLKVKIADSHHIKACELCRMAGSVHTECYYAQLRLCLTHGWRPLIDRENIKETYHVSGNYSSIELFQVTATKEFEKMCDSGSLVRLPENSVGIINPLGAVIKSSDKHRTKVLTGVSIVDQKSLSQANILLEELGYPAVKARLTTDVTAPGTNRSAYVPPFRYPSLADGIRIITPNCYLAKADVSRYFLMFPLSICSYYLFMVRWLGALFGYVRCMFGLASCPYYCSILSAEFRLWFYQTESLAHTWLMIGSRAVTHMRKPKGICMP